MDLIKLLIARSRINGHDTKAFINSCGKTGTPLMLACDAASEEVVDLLLGLDEGVNVDRRTHEDDGHQSALHILCSETDNKESRKRIITSLLIMVPQ